jgi:D-proline reductase (dithiol) PrdB
MVRRLSELPEVEAKHLSTTRIVCPTYDDTPLLPGKPLAERRVAIISTAGLHKRGDRAFDRDDGSYRVIPAETPASDLVMSHVSVNFDRTGFQQDHNVVFPIDRLRELVADGALFLHGRVPGRGRGATRPASRGAAQGRQGRRRPACPCLTRLHARRGRAGPLPGA